MKYNIFRSNLLILVSLLFLTMPLISQESERSPLMRFPDIHGDKIVFVHGEDIWIAPIDGGVAQRLTIHDGEEEFPKFSPDGKLIAFTAQYDGNRDVYVMDVHGGNITRVTYHPYRDDVVGWHPLKNKIIFRSRRDSYQYYNRLFLISPDGTGLERLIMHEASHASYSPDGSKIAYNKLERENRTWKRYRGGTAQDLYLYDFSRESNTQLTQFPGTDRLPMWHGNSIYFSSDRDRVLNIYGYDLQSGEIERLTTHSEYDVRRPSMGGSQIVYELGGSLWVLDVVTKVNRQIPIAIRADAPEVRPFLKDVKDQITDFDISPDGSRALVVARGEIFSVPKENGPTRNMTRDSGARDKDAAWSPDGKSVAYISDRDGEYNIYIVDQAGRKQAVKLTKFDSGYRHTLRWSPDSKMIAFADQTLRLYTLEVKTGKITKVDKAHYENVDISLDLKPIHDFTWSPDSRYIAYSKMNADLVTQLYIYSIESGNAVCVSNGLFNDFNPVFSTDGKHLLFISNRRFDPTFCDFEWEMVYKKVAGIYSLTLSKEGAPLLPLKSDEYTGKKEKAADSKKSSVGTTSIDFDGIAGRIEALPVERGNYRNLFVNENSVFYLNADEGDFNRFEFRAVGPKPLYAFDIDAREERTVIDGIDAYKLSADGSSIIYRKGNDLGIIASDSKESKGEAIKTTDLKLWLDPVSEWTQIFNEAWRMQRDFYYEPNMHGIDWNAMKVKYGKLIPHASCRQDVRYIIGELIGELNTSHTYVFGGDSEREADAVNIGMLGVDWRIDQKNKRYQFGKIYRVTDWTDGINPPLQRPGIHVKENDYLLQVNGINVSTDSNIYSYFQNLAGKQVSMLVNDKPVLAGATEIVVTPVRSEFRLRYLDWLERNRLLVDKLSDGQIGYLHLPDTYTGSTREFPKYFYSQTRKKGIIVDGRFNRGGLDPDIFLQRLAKAPLAYWTRRYSHDQTTPSVATTAHMVCLTNRQAGSGGDMLPMEFQMKKMGPVIGTRTWGGLVGVSMFISLIDGGGFTAPDYRIYDPDGNWIVENKGVEPDIIVDLDPNEMARGYDAQLRKGVEVLMKKIREEPRPWPEHAPFPIDK